MSSTTQPPQYGQPTLNNCSEKIKHNWCGSHGQTYYNSATGTCDCSCDSFFTGGRCQDVDWTSLLSSKHDPNLDQNHAKHGKFLQIMAVCMVILTISLVILVGVFYFRNRKKKIEKAKSGCNLRNTVSNVPMMGTALVTPVGSGGQKNISVKTV